jgi:hypothetical protein
MRGQDPRRLMRVRPTHPCPKRFGGVHDCAAMVNGKLTYLWAAERVLRKHGQPLRVREIVD